MDLRARYIIALRRMGDRMVLDRSPSQLAEAACEVLGADGAGLVMRQQLVRLPIGATGSAARTAEEIQASLGDGPCLVAMSTGAVLTATESELAGGWPLYHRALVDRTGFRSTLSLPLGRPGAPAFAALNLYFSRPEPVVDHPVETIRTEIAQLVGMLLLGMPTDIDELPVGSDQQQVERRHRVGVATGRLMEAASVGGQDALALLRGYAFRHDVLLDELASRLVDGRTTTAEVLATGAGG